jgi:2-oxo-hept-3-ene-1,7-dioate hydratase
MTLPVEMIGALAAELDMAERTRIPVRQFSLRYPAMTMEDAYRIQESWVATKIENGRRIIGHKIGLTSRAMQRAGNIDEPDYGTLLDDMLFVDGGEIPAGRFIIPRVEVELAFILKSDLSGPNCTLFDVLDATDYVVPALELIDARILRVDPETGTTRKVLDTIADNAANGGIILGGRPVGPLQVDLRWVSALVSRNAVIEETGVAAAVLNHPGNGVAWLANKLYPHGIALRASEIILGGSFTAPVAAEAGDIFHVDYGPLGTISCRFG